MRKYEIRPGLDAVNEAVGPTAFRGVRFSMLLFVVLQSLPLIRSDDAVSIAPLYASILNILVM